MHKHFSEETPKSLSSVHKKDGKVCEGKWGSIIITACAFVVIIIILLSYFGVEELRSQPVVKEQIECTHLECLKSSVEISSFIDPGVDPCDDFYSFACGKYLRTVTHGDPPMDPLLWQKQMIQKQLDAFIVKPIEEGIDSQMVMMQKKFYRACMNTEAMDADKDQTFLDLIDAIGGWPLKLGPDWPENSFDWVNITLKLRRLGLPFEWFLAFRVYSDESNNYLWITHPECTDLLKFRTTSYKNFMNDLAAVFHRTRFVVGREFQKVREFALELARVCDRSQPDEVALATIEELEMMWPKLNWEHFIQNLTDMGGEDVKNLTIATDVYNYIRDLDNLLVHTSKKIQGNYIVWRLYEAFAPFLSNSSRNVKLFHQPVPSREEFCLEETKSRFHLVSQTEFIRRHATSDVKEAVREIAESIADSFETHVEAIDFITEDLKIGFLEEFQSYQYIIGGQDEIFDEEIFEQFLLIGQLNFSSDNIIDMLREKSLAHMDSIVRSASEPLKANFSGADVYTKNVEMDCYLDEFEQTIVVPAALLQDFTFNVDRPKYLNYASLGPIIARTMIRHFGQRVSEGENVTQIVIGDDAKNMTMDYVTVVSCVLDSFVNIKAEEMDLNERYAHFAAINLAYEAYRNFFDEDPEEEREELALPGLDYTPDQLFWIKSSSNWCKKIWTTEDFLDPLAQSLVNGPLKNSDEFAEKFSCPQDTPMNPEKKCTLI